LQFFTCDICFHGEHLVVIDIIPYVIYFDVKGGYAITKPQGMQSSIFLCLSQARINWEGYGRKGIRHKNGGMMEVAR